MKIDADTKLKNIEAVEMEIKYSFIVTDDPTQQSGLSVKDADFDQQVETAVKASACLNKNTRRYYVNSGCIII